jgi:LssY C-terminus
MWRLPILALASLSAISTLAHGQSTADSQELSFQVAPSGAWVDTGLDLQPGVTLTVSTSLENATDSGLPACDPAGIKNTTDPSQSLPLPSAPAGALIARLHGATSVPILVGSANELKIQDASHLSLAMNVSGAPVCQGTYSVRVQKNSERNSNTSAKPRGQQLKSQLFNAAGVFMSGQFGTGKSESAPASTSPGLTSAESSATASPLTTSDTPLDADLRRHLDSLPRRVNDQLNNLGDMVNFVIIGSEKDVQAALNAATWHIADSDNRKAMINAVMQTYDQKDYLAMPMSTLYLFGRKQDFGYEMAEPIAMVASRHHFRIWKAPFEWEGKEVWVGAGTHDIGFARDQRNNGVTHKIDPAVDGERDNIGMSLQKANKAKSIAYYLPTDPVREAKNATGDGYHSDGRLLVVFLQ